MPGMFEPFDSYVIEEVFPAPDEASRYPSIEAALEAAAPYLLRLMQDGMELAGDENKVVDAQGEPA